MDELMFRPIYAVIGELEELTYAFPEGRLRVSLGDGYSELTIDQMKHILKLARLGQSFKSMIRGANELG